MYTLYNLIFITVEVKKYNGEKEHLLYI